MYAGGRPLWQLSVAYQGPRGPVPVLRWSPGTHRLVEAARDRILARHGTNEPLIEAPDVTITRQWRKPLRVDEVAQLAQTPEVRARPGRP